MFLIENVSYLSQEFQEPTMNIKQKSGKCIFTNIKEFSTLNIFFDRGWFSTDNLAATFKCKMMIKQLLSAEYVDPGYYLLISLLMK